ncbi:MAG: hypothetical protein OHK0019_12490 [Saprospiraceae bacterium]
MRFIALSIILIFIVSQANAQTIANSIFVEYGYPNIPKDSTTIHMMFGYSKYRIYADDKFVKVETFQDLPEEMAKEMGAGLRSSFIKERASGDVFICVVLDSLLIRLKGGEKEQATFKEVTETFNSGTAAVFGKGNKRADIQGFSCEQYWVKGTYSDTVSAYVTDRVVLEPTVKDFPLYVAGEGKNYGLMLGRDEVLWNGYTLEFRALKVEINQPRDLAKELASYKLVTEEEGDKLIRDWFSKLMGMPVEGKN